VILAVRCSLAQPAPVERVRFETSQGAFVIEAHRSWAPHAFDRFHELVASHFFDGARFFRVRAGFIAQFGIPGDPKLASEWRNRTIPDDPVRQTNARGTLAFASLPEPNSRTTQIFINLADNARLDPQGFAPFARVVSGMDVVDRLYSGYGEAAAGGMRAGHQQKLFEEGNAYLEREFPKLDVIVRADFVR
jgi:cyclophilin family peptidyl-prolyl cis-trans isomerase